jgi:hypothetical protein
VQIVSDITPNPGFWQWMQSVADDTEKMAVFMLPLFFIVLAIIVTIGLVSVAIHRRRVEAALKRELLDRGLSAEEIATIIRATSTRERVAESRQRSKTNEGAMT